MLMDPSLLGSIIGAGATLSVPIVSWLIARSWTTRRFYPMSSDQRRVMSGSWVGTEIQEESVTLPEIESYVKFTLTAHRKLIHGEYYAQYEDGTWNLEANLKVRGGFLQERFLKFDYVNRDISVQRFGTILLLWTPTGHLEGSIVGFSAVNRAIMSGKIHLEKVG